MKNYARYIVMIIFVIVAIVGLVMADNYTKIYEYYTLEDDKGYSRKCEAKDILECEIDGAMVEVKQFSRER